MSVKVEAGSVTAGRSSVKAEQRQKIIDVLL
jgi:hypothetical protein